MNSGQQRHRSSAGPLGVAWMALVVYASLFPFSGWRWPAGAQLTDLLGLPWPRYVIGFDVTSNLLGYLPLGFLLALTRAGLGARWHRAMATALLTAAGLSYAMELTQNLLNERVPSLLDWVLNAAGAALGAMTAWWCHRFGWLRRWQAARARWLDRGSAGAFALLLLWPAALLFPTPVPLGLGQIFGTLRELALDGLQDVSWARTVSDWLAADAPSTVALSPPVEGVAVVLGLLSPCLLAFAASRPGWRRAWLAVGAALTAVAATTLSTALNFGPDHALAWRTATVGTAMGLALAIALALAWVDARLAAGLALVSLTGLVMLVHQAPHDPYFAQSLQGWEQGRFIRFHGLAQWLGWLWPYVAMIWLLARIGTSDRRPGA